MYFKRIADRNRNKALEKVSEYRMLLQICVAPYTEKGAGVQQVQNQLTEMEKDLKNPERIASRKETRGKLEELLLKQINSFNKKEG